MADNVPPLIFILSHLQDIASLGNQLKILYGVNKKQEHPWKLHWTSYGGKIQQEIEKNDGWSYWSVNYNRMFAVSTCFKLSSKIIHRLV